MIGTNNPLNIRYVKRNNWLGQTGQYKGFICFSHVDYCIRCCAYLIMRSYPKRGIRTYYRIIQTYAPESENDTLKYARFVTKQMRKSLLDVPSTIPAVALMIHYMWIFESGRNSDLFDLNRTEYIESIIYKYHLKF